MRLYALGVLLAALALAPIAQAQVRVPNAGPLNSAQPVFCVNPTSGAVEDCVGGSGATTATIVAPLGTQTIPNSVAMTSSAGAIVDLGTGATPAANTTNNYLQTLAAKGPSIAPTASASAESCHVFKASAGTLYAASGYIGAAGYIMIFNATSAPADGAVVPFQAPIYVPAAGTWAISYQNPSTQSVGITICASTTGPLTKTAYATNTVFSAQWQ